MLPNALQRVAPDLTLYVYGRSRTTPDTNNDTKMITKLFHVEPYLERKVATSGTLSSAS